MNIKEVIEGLENEVKGYLQAIQSADNACKNDDARPEEFNYDGWRKSIEVLTNAINIILGV